MSYKLYVIDETGHSASWSHTNGHRGKPCLCFPDDKNSVVILEHASQTTHLYISSDGMLNVEVIENEPEPEPKPIRRRRRRK